MMDLDKLKTCAEALGYKPIYDMEGRELLPIKEGGIYIDTGKLCPEIYDPEHNDAQAFELLKWLMKQPNDRYLSIEDMGDRVHIEMETDRKHIEVLGQTLNQAVIEAVWEVKK